MQGGTRVRLVGINSFGVLSGYLGVGQVTSPSSSRKIEDAVHAKVTVLRFLTDIAPSDYWFNQAYRKWNLTSDHLSYLQGLESLIANLKSKGIYAIPCLVSYPDGWSKLVGGTNFWTVGSRANLKWKEWVKSIVVYFRNEPQILAWELASEANYFASPAGGCHGGCASTDQLITWARDAHSFIKGLDINHLVEGGWNNTGDLDQTKFRNLNGFLEITTIHIYKGHFGIDTQSEVDSVISQYISTSKNMGKPFYLGEFGADLKTNPTDHFLDWMYGAVHKFEGDVATMWSWEEGTDPYRLDVSDNYQVNVIAKWSTA